MDGRDSAAGVVDVETVPVASGPQAMQRVGTQALSDALEIVREPAEVLRKAAAAARALMEAIGSKPRPVMMNDEQYLELEDWQLVAAFHGCSIKMESDEFVQYGNASGWEATMLLMSRDGREIGRATMMCMDDEEKWGTRPKYAWLQQIKPEIARTAKYDGIGVEHESKLYVAREDVKDSSDLVWQDTTTPHPTREGQFKQKPASARLQVGEESVPMFQLRSMAQTRAASKVARLNLSYIPMLAGLRTTPAEELPDAAAVDRTTVTIASTAKTAGKQAVDAAVKAAGPQAQDKAQERRDGGSTASTSAATNGAQAGTQAAGPGNGSKAGDLGRAITNGEKKDFWDFVTAQGFSVPDVAQRIRTKYGHASSTELTLGELQELQKWIRQGGGDEAAGRDVGQEG